MVVSCYHIGEVDRRKKIQGEGKMNAFYGSHYVFSTLPIWAVALGLYRAGAAMLH
jgi:hypothetical protein